MSKQFNLGIIGAILVSSALVGVGVQGLLAQEAVPEKTSHTASAQVRHEAGHYQLQDVSGTPYLLDTETGRVWVSHREVILGSHSDFTADGGKTYPLPLTKSVWTEQSPEWASGR